MKLHIFDEVESKDVYLKLIKDFGGNICVCAADIIGEVYGRGYLITFKKNGSISLHDNIYKSLGFKLDEYGRLEVENDRE